MYFKEGTFPMKKISALVLCLILLSLSLTACAPGGPGGKEAPLTLTLVVSGGFGDRSFYDSSLAGCTRLAEEGAELHTIECHGQDHSQKIYEAAESSDLVVLVGWEFFEVEAIAAEYPDVRFIWVDNAASTPVPNLLNITYAQNEGSFLAGYLAAGMSETGILGAIGVKDSTTFDDFTAGFAAGAAYARPGTTLLTGTVSSYDDPISGKSEALRLHEQGADVIFQVASKAGDGIFEAAEEEGFYVIGVDSDQKYIAPDVIICSMCKHVGDSIYEAVRQYMEEGDGCGLFGTTWLADMKSGLVSIGYGEEGAPQQIPQDLKDQAAMLEQKIISGEIRVPSARHSF